MALADSGAEFQEEAGQEGDGKTFGSNTKTTSRTGKRNVVLWFLNFVFFTFYLNRNLCMFGTLAIVLSCRVLFVMRLFQFES